MLLVLVITVLCVSAEQFDSQLAANFSSLISSVIAENEIGTEEAGSTDSPVNVTFPPLFYPASSVTDELSEGRSFQPKPQPKTFSPRFQMALENARRRKTSIGTKPQRKFFLPVLGTGPNHGYSGSYPSNFKGYGPPKSPPVNYYPPPSPPRPSYYPPHRPPSSGYGAPKPGSAYKPTYGAPVKPYYPAPNPVASYPSYPSGPAYAEKPTYPATPSYPSYPSYTEKPSYPATPSYPSGPVYSESPTYPAAPVYPTTTSYPATVGYPAVPSYPSTPKPVPTVSYPSAGYQPSAQVPGYPSGYPGTYPSSNYQPQYPPASYHPSHPKPGYIKPNPGFSFFGYPPPKPVHVYPPSNYGFNKPSLPPGVYPPAKPSSGYGVPKGAAISYSNSYSATKEYSSSEIEAQSYSASGGQNPSYKTGNFDENQLSSYTPSNNYSPPYVGTATESNSLNYPTTPSPAYNSYQGTFVYQTTPTYSPSAAAFTYQNDITSTPPPSYNPPAILLAPSSGNSAGTFSSSLQSNPPKWSRPITTEFQRTPEQPQILVQFGPVASSSSLESSDVGRFNRQLQPKCNTSHDETSTPQPSDLSQAVIPLPSTSQFIFPSSNEVVTETNIPRHFGHSHQQHRPNDCGGPWVLLDSPFGFQHVNVEPIRPQGNSLPSFAGSNFRGIESQPNPDGFSSNSFPIDVRDKVRFETIPSVPATSTTPESSNIGASIFVRDNLNPTTIAPASSTDNSIVFSNVKPPSLSDVLSEQNSHPSPFLFTRGRPGMDNFNRTSSEDSPKKSKTVTFASNQVTSDNALQKNSIVQQLARINLRALSSLIQRAGIAPILDDEAELTIFAPSNVAFGDVASEVRDQWGNDIDSLREILLYHVVPGKLVTNILRNEETPLTYAGSHRLRINIYNSTDVKRIITVNGARLVTSDIRIGNALIHVIDRVLEPIPQQTIADIINNGGLQAAILGPHLANVLLTPTPLTVFVPTTEAFLSLSGEERDLFQNDTAFHDIIWYHAIPGSFYSEGLQDGQWLASLRGPGAIQVQVLNDGRRSRLVSVNGVANVVRSDVSATNGVVHFIDRILTNIIPNPTI